MFRAGAEPFVAPSGGRLDEIIRAVRDCPSGALSLALGKEEARLLVDWDGEREAAIEVSLDGPYRVTGAIPLTDAAGTDVARAAGSSREHYALCRCGHSRNKPFCSGMHWYIGVPRPGTRGEPTLFQWAGGLPALTRMTRLLYEKHVPADDLLAPAFADMPPGHPQREAMWLAEVFGGPARYSQRSGGAAGPRRAHAGRGLAEEQRARWVDARHARRRRGPAARRPRVPRRAAGYLDWGSRTARAESAVSAAPGPAAGRAPAGESMPSWDWGPAGPPGRGRRARPSRSSRPSRCPDRVRR